MSYTIGYRMPMRDRPRVRVRLVYDVHGDPSEATERAMDRLAGLPDGTVVEAFRVMAGDNRGRGGDEKIKPPEPSSGLPLVFAVWDRELCVAYYIGPGGVPALVSPSGLAYPSEDGGMSFELPSNDALSVLVTMGEEEDWGWKEDEAIESMPDGSVVECLWMEDGEPAKSIGLVYGRGLAMLDPVSNGTGGLT